jgi:rhamnulokinase
VAAVPATQPGRRWAYLSSGTWSLLGVELDQPFANSESCSAPFTNERGINQTVRFLKNIGGLWLVQELKREIDQQGQEVTFEEMVKLARLAAPWRTLINPNDSRFATPGGMSQKLQQFAEKSGQPQPTSIGERVRCCLESLAFSYRDTVDRLEQILQLKIDDLYIVGGGTQNVLLNELTVSTLQRPVICGPVEATAIGNLLVQALGCGIIPDLQAMRSIVARSFDVQRHEAGAGFPIDESHFVRYRTLIQ